MTFDEIVDDAASITKDTSTAAKTVIKKGINKGLMRLRPKLKRTYAVITRRFVYTAGQAEYQLPENTIRVARIYYFESGNRHKLVRIDDENEWDSLRTQGGQTGQPTHYRITSKDLYEVYPAPSAAGMIGEIKYQSRAKQLTAADYKVGTISVTSGSATVTGNGTTFTPNMIGRFIKLEQSDQEKSDYYQIIAVDSATSLVIENFYDGPTQSAQTYRIGEVPNLPEEYHAALSDYGTYYFYLWRKDKEMAKEFNANFLEALATIDDEYSSDTVSSVIESKRNRTDDMLPNYRRTPKAIV
jgi:hypothetical protein